MATLAGNHARYSDDRTFFRVTAILMAAVIVAGFSTNLIFGRSSFAVPLIFHAHAVVFFGWVVLYVTQNLLATGGPLALHRRLGWLAVAWIPVMAVLGMTLVIHVIRERGGPFFFDQNRSCSATRWACWLSPGWPAARSCCGGTRNGIAG